tara:strand:- start:85 stop:546 length:462 start_codon:yes stop_codon:yes gene_type:complete
MSKNFRLFYILFFIFIISCGYQPIFQKKDINFKINEIIATGDNKANYTLINNLKSFNKSENFLNVYDLVINSNKTRQITSKDTKGNPKTYKLNLVVEIKVYLNKEIKTTEFYDKSFYYNNIDSKFELSQYEETVLNNLLENISQEFLFKLQAL